MHALQAIAVVAVLAVGFGASWLCFQLRKRKRGAIRTASCVNQSASTIKTQVVFPSKRSMT